MRKVNFRRVLGLLAVLLMAGSLAVSCYDDSELRDSINDLKNQLTQLQTLVSTLQNDDAVVGVDHNPDGSYTIKFKKSGSVTIKDGKPGEDGKDGKDGSIVSVIQGLDTYTFYFTDGTVITLPRYCETRVLTFEDTDYKGSSEILNYWTSMIDEPQYGGPILYGEGCTWKDEYNTFLSGSVLPYDETTWSGGYSGGGIAISNYGDWLMINVDYKQQLTCYNYDLPDGTSREKAGHNQSNNFAVVYDAGQWGANPAALSFADGEPRVVESLYIVNTLYTHYVLFYGNDFCAPLANNGFFKVTATGYLGDTVTGTSDFYLANKNQQFVTKWTEWKLSDLGFVDKIVFSMSGSEELYGDWGINAPTYFAIDDIAVRYYPD
ncbi:MAG: DUF4988 and DUF4465 domain-containing protein [Bacteroidales bacterium]|nr:DUF4988 and DUF4465 domain-containing protein [Bacteroidales bacterium]